MTKYDRLDKLKMLSLIALETLEAELVLPSPSEAVIEACTIARRLLAKEMEGKKDFLEYRQPSKGRKSER